MTMDIYWIELDEQRRNYLMGLCGDNRYRIVEPDELTYGLPDSLQQYSFARKIGPSLVVKKIATWPGGSSATVLLADIHRYDAGGYEYDQQPFLLAHHSGESTASASGMFINEGDWADRTIRHWTGPGPLETLTQINNSGIDEYYPGNGIATSRGGDISDLYNTTYRHTLENTIHLMRRD